MAELLLELFSEEIPARMQARAADDLKRLVTAGLKEAGLDHGDARAYVTPRRLTLVVEDLPDKQPDLREEKRGPKVDAPEKAIEGFLKANGLTLSQCEERDLEKGRFLFAVVEKSGAETRDVLPALLEKAIGDMPWPKSMRWGDGDMRWVRSLERVLCLFGEDVLPLALRNEIACGNTRRDIASWRRSRLRSKTSPITRTSCVTPLSCSTATTGRPISPNMPKPPQGPRALPCATIRACWTKSRVWSNGRW